MKHAFIITAYCEFDLLYEQLCAYSKIHDCYVHIDKKSVVPEELQRRFRELPNVHVIQRYKINWGGIQHVYAILDLIRMASESDIEYDYYHIMSANSMPIKPIQEFLAFFEANNGKNFMEVISADKLENPELIRERYRYYYFQFFYNIRGKHRKIWRKFEYYSKQIQAKLGVSRKRKFEYKGYVYCSITQAFVRYILKYCEEHPEYLKCLKYCWVSEEFFFQNLLMESSFADTLVNDPLIYNVWDDPVRSYPALLDMRDYEEICTSKAMFARKISKDEESMQLVKNIFSKCMGYEMGGLDNGRNI